jgi:cytochrome c553
LRSFKARTRGDFDGSMTSAVQVLSEREIDILSDYLSGLNPLQGLSARGTNRMKGGTTS